MSDKDDYNTAEDALHLRRQERINAETRERNAMNEDMRCRRIATALAALPPDASILDINRAIWNAASEQAANWVRMIGRDAAAALDAENEAVLKVNAIAARLLALPPESR